MRYRKESFLGQEIEIIKDMAAPFIILCIGFFIAIGSRFILTELVVSIYHRNSVINHLIDKNTKELEFFYFFSPIVIFLIFIFFALNLYIKKMKNKRQKFDY
jgi:hypothetical protein